jgi:epoxyqueuosine reductase
LRFASPTHAPEFQPRPWLRSLRANDLLRLTATEFQDALMHSPLKRARRAGILRNAAIAAANLKDPDAPPALRALLEAESDSDLRDALDWALAQFPGEGSPPAGD